MKMLMLLAAMTLAACAGNDQRAPVLAMEERARILNRSDHLLSIVTTESVQEGKHTWYRMDETNLGEGAAGASAVMGLMQEMKPGTILKIYSKAGFDISTFEREGERRGLLVRPVAK